MTDPAKLTDLVNLTDLAKRPPAGAVVQPGNTPERQLVQAVKMLAAAFPRAAWKVDSDAVYAMALAGEGISPAVARAAIRKLITEQMELPPVALVLRACREVEAEHLIKDWACPVCGSAMVSGIIDGPAVCFDCDWHGTLR